MEHSLSTETDILWTSRGVFLAVMEPKYGVPCHKEQTGKEI